MTCVLLSSRFTFANYVPVLHGRQLRIERYWGHLCAIGRMRTITAGHRASMAVRFPKWQLPTNYFVTTPIYYLNAAPHIGHLYTNIVADVISRWYKMLGVPVVFSTGSDEHGLKVQQAAAANSKDPQTFCDEGSAQFKKLFTSGDIEFTDFIRTSEPRHHSSVRRLWGVLHDRGHIYKGSYEGWYCVSDESFLSSDQVMDETDPSGNNIKVSKESGHLVEWMKEDNYIFRLSEFAEPLTRWLDEKVIVPVNFEPVVRQMILEGLKDLSVSRPSARIPWGIRVPGDETQTIYVWLDALTNYLTVGGFPNEGHQWPADCHVVGKDIIKFHAIYWPAFLMAAGLEPPRKVLCHSHWMINKEKMSKSLGNVVDPFDRLQHYSSDGLRYYLMRDGVAHSDGNYCDERATECINTDLVNTLCNLVSRCVAKSVNRDQILPSFDSDVFQRLAADDEQDIMEYLYQLPDIVDDNYRNFTIHHAIEATMTCLYRANSFVQRHQPWLLAKSSSPDDLRSLHCVIHVALESARVAALALNPVIPRLSCRILDRLGSSPDERTWFHMTQSVGVRRPLGAVGGLLFQRVKS